MNSREIRKQFLEFFAERQHEIVPSSPVVPLDDPTLMFANAGMNQFKDVFLGTGSRSYTRAADTQKCIRAGGKHNDLDDVGQDTYHQTFFEMLGNWSFGDYFKKEAIRWAWELLTDVWGIEKDRLHATYFEGDAAEGLEPDEDAAKLWRSVTDIDPTHIHPGNRKDNFWEMGDTGPCGPCSEIHVDLTPDKSGGALVNAGDPNVIELWNLVFIQFNRAADGKLTPLPAKHVDTGMGFERLCAILNGKNSNYDTDVFAPIFSAIKSRCSAPDYKGTLPTDPKSETVPQDHVMTDVTYRVIADHVRCLVFAFADGAYPSNEGRGYVLRRILRRAVRYGRQYFNMNEPFLCDLVQPLIDQMGDVFPELTKRPDHIIELVRDEEASFGRTWQSGISLFESAADGLSPIQDFVKHMTKHQDQMRKLCESSPMLRVVQQLQEQHTRLAKAFGGLGRLVDQVDRSVRPLLEAHEDIRKTIEPILNSQRNWSGMIRAIVSEMPVDRMQELLKARTKELEKADKIFSKELALVVFANPYEIPGEVAFKLHDTHGFPIDLTTLMAEERGLQTDIGEYERLMDLARERARAGADMPIRSQVEVMAQRFSPTEFLGYDQTETQTVLVGVFYYKNGELRRGSLAAEQSGALVCRATTFYAEQGGQVGDMGTIVDIDHNWEFEVKDTTRIGDAYLHMGMCKDGQIIPRGSADVSSNPTSSSRPRRPGDVLLSVDLGVRRPTEKNHTSTHLLNWALREVLGEHVQQKGSLVDPEKTRFDFSHGKPVTVKELTRTESLVTEQIEANIPVYVRDDVDQQDARKINTLRAVFGEKYPDIVRVVSIGADIDEMLDDPTNDKWMKHSVEFCGGTHLQNSGEALAFTLISEEAVAKGVRRVVGITGEAAVAARTRGEALAKRVAAMFGKPPGDVAAEIGDVGASLSESVIPVCTAIELREKFAELQKIARKHGKDQASAVAGDVLTRAAELLAEAQTVGATQIIVGEVPHAGPDALRGAIDWFRNKTESSAVMLACHDGEKVTLLAGMSRDVVKKGVKAGDLIKEIAPIVGGRGGGRPDMAQGGGSNASAVSDALEHARDWLIQRLAT